MNLVRPSFLTSRSHTYWWLGVRVEGSEASFGTTTNLEI
jgi:hypothetical protein